MSALAAFADWLEWLESHDGRLYRRAKGGDETDWDVACTVPSPHGGQALVTVGELRQLVEAAARGSQVIHPSTSE